MTSDNLDDLIHDNLPPGHRCPPFNSHCDLKSTPDSGLALPEDRGGNELILPHPKGGIYHDPRQSFEKKEGLAGVKYVVHRKTIPLQFPKNQLRLNRGSVKLESGVCKTPICCKHFHLLKNRYEEPNNMILYDIIRYHNPPILPQGGVLGGTIFFEGFLPGC